jgi:hypothetical protein
MRRKYKQFGHYFGDKFVLAITFYHLYMFRNRFGCESAFLLNFEETLMTIFIAITITAFMAVFQFLPLWPVSKLVCTQRFRHLTWPKILSDAALCEYLNDKAACMQ